MAADLPRPASEAATAPSLSLPYCLLAIAVVGVSGIAIVIGLRSNGERRRRRADRIAQELIEAEPAPTPIASTSTAVAPTPPSTAKRRKKQPVHRQIYVPPLPPGTVVTRSVAVQTEAAPAAMPPAPALGRRSSRRQSGGSGRSDVEAERAELLVKLRALDTRRKAQHSPLQPTVEMADEPTAVSPACSVSTPIAPTAPGDEGGFQLTRSHKRRGSSVSSPTLSRAPSQAAEPASASSSSDRSPSSSVSTLATTISAAASPKLTSMSRTSSAHPTPNMATPPTRRASQPSVASTEDDDDDSYWSLDPRRAQVSPTVARTQPRPPRPPAITVPTASISASPAANPAPPSRSPGQPPPRMHEQPRVPGGDFYFSPAPPPRSRDNSAEGRRMSLPVGMPGPMVMAPGPSPRRPPYPPHGYAAPVPLSPHMNGSYASPAGRVLSPPGSPAPSPARVHRSSSGTYPSNGAPSPGTIQQQQYAWQLLAAAQHQQHQMVTSQTHAMVAAYQTGQLVAFNQQHHQAYARAQSPRARPPGGLSATSRRNSYNSGQASSAGAARSEPAIPKTRDEELESLRRSTRAFEIENERKSKELEIAHWRLECVEVERRAEERQTQEAICFFVERAESAEARVRSLEAQLNSASADESEAAGSVSGQGSPRARSPALPPLDSQYDPRKLMSPLSASALLSPYANGSPVMPPMRRRRSNRRRSHSTAGSVKSRASGADDGDDEVRILLSTPALARSVNGGDDADCGLGLAWEAGTSASSVGDGDGDDFVGHVPAMFARIPDPSLRIQPATPTDPILIPQ